MLFITLVVGVVGSLVMIGVNEHFKRRSMMCEFVWRHKAEAYGDVMRILGCFSLVSSILSGWFKEMEKHKEKGKVAGWLLVVLQLVEGRVVGKFGGLGGEFERVRRLVLESWKATGKEFGNEDGDMKDEALAEEVYYLISQVFTMLLGELDNTMDSVWLLVDEKLDCHDDIQRIVGLMLASGADTDGVKTLELGKRWSALSKSIENGLRSDMRNTLKV